MAIRESTRREWTRRLPKSALCALLLLSLLGTGEVLRVGLFPGFSLERVPFFQRQALSFFLFALVAGIASVIRGARPPRGSRFRDALLLGLGLFVVPAGLLFMAAGTVSGFGRTALFTLVPVFAVVFEPYAGRDAGSQSRFGLMAALAAVAGALFVFPVELPVSLQAGMGFSLVILAAACVAFFNCRAVVLFAEAPGKFQLTIAVAAGATVAICLGGASLSLERTVWDWEILWPALLWAAAVELPGLLLLFWLMSRMTATRMAVRYLLAPVLAIVLGALAMQTRLQIRTFVGLMMMTAGAGYLLFAQEAEPENQAFSLKR